MNNKLVPKNNNIIPRKFAEMTLGELMTQEDVDIRIKNNKTTIRKTTPTETISMEIRTYDYGYEVSESKFHVPDQKKDLKDDIIKMREDGRTQKEIADSLGMSQPYVSKMLKKK